ncbi:MAG TPA: GntR family transcriptional regulator [Anaerolineaceae bacterium]|nr:GntR family transcriptional regulator [Anaerolineaceae bacterium]
MATLTKIDGVPLYVQIRNSLHEDISKKILQPGQKLPSEDELAVRFGVSRMTVRQGISDLIDEGLLYRRHGVGTFVAHPHIERDHSRLESFIESARDDGIDLDICVLIADILPAKLKVARSLSLEEGDLVVRVKTLRLVDDVPITLHDAYVPYRLFPQLLQEDLEAQHLWAIFESYGFRVKRAIQHLEAREADEEISGILKMDEGAPILYKERTVYLDDGTPVEFTYCYNRGDRYSLTVVLDR